MATWTRARKCDLVVLAAESGVEILSSDTAKMIIKKIKEADDHEDEWANSQISFIEKDRLAAEQAEQAERQRAYEIEEKERANAHELEKLRLTHSSDTISISSTHSEREPRLLLKNIIQKFDPDSSDIVMYLNLFQRQATRANINKEDWVTNLLGFLPANIAEIILREPNDRAEDFDYVKEKLLERFRLSPEDFRIKFVSTPRSEHKSWKDFRYEISNYLDEWLAGVKVSEFQELKDLILTDQMKRKVPAEVREHFIDSWGSMVKSEELASKLDAYETVRRSTRKTPFFKTLNADRKPLDKPNFKENLKKPESKKNEGNWRNKDNDKGREEIFERKRDRTCFLCGSTMHIKYNCPNYAKKLVKTESVNHVANSEILDETFTPFLSRGLVNGSELDILRDTGASIDVISANYVDHSSFNGKVLVRQALDNEFKCLPVTDIVLEIPNVGVVKTKAVVVNKDVIMQHYLLGNKTQKLLDNLITNTESVRAVITRQQAKHAIRENIPTPPLKKDKVNIGDIDRSAVSPAVEPEKTLTLTKEDGSWLQQSEEITKENSLATISREKLIAEQKVDDTLKVIHEKADLGKSKFNIKNGLISRKIKDHQREETVNLILPNKLEQPFIDEELEIPQLNITADEADFQNMLVNSNVENRCSKDQISV